MSTPLRVLVVDDSGEHAELVREMVRVAGSWPDAVVEQAGSYAAALETVSRQSYDLAFFDYWLGAEDGLRLLRDVRQRGFDLRPDDLVEVGGNRHHGEDGDDSEDRQHLRQGETARLGHRSVHHVGL